MKKLMFMAMMAVVATSASAQDIKAILKAKTYSEAETMIKSSLSSLDNADKAKAYNKLVQLSVEKINKEQEILSNNALAVQLKQDKVEPYDTVGFNKAICTAVQDAMECDKYDNMPNAKGKISPKFHKANQEKLWNLRLNLINAGQDAANANKMDEAALYYGVYVESSSNALFADRDKEKFPDQYVGQVARVASVLAFQTYNDALDLKMYLMQQSLKNHDDSVKCVKQFEALYAKDKRESIFSNLASMYGNLGMEAEQAKLIADKIAEDPKCYAAYALKAQAEMNAAKWDEAIADFKKAHEIDPKKSIVCTYIGFCINSKAAGVSDNEAQKKLLEDSVVYLEKARDLDPDRKESNWSYPLYQCYYTLYGENDSRTQEMSKLSGQ